MVQSHFYNAMQDFIVNEPYQKGCIFKRHAQINRTFSKRITLNSTILGHFFIFPFLYCNYHHVSIIIEVWVGAASMVRAGAGEGDRVYKGCLVLGGWGVPSVL